MAKKVLVVDDDQNTVRFLSVVLEENGYEAVAAYDGSEGLKKVQQARPDLIVLDVMMPKKSGFTLFKQLKRDNAFKAIPVLMLTGVAGVLEGLDEQMTLTYDRPFDSLREALRKAIKEMRDEGLVRPNMFLDKPVDPDTFINRVKELVGT